MYRSIPLGGTLEHIILLILGRILCVYMYVYDMIIRMYVDIDGDIDE